MYRDFGLGLSHRSRLILSSSASLVHGFGFYVYVSLLRAFPPLSPHPLIFGVLNPLLFGLPLLLLNLPALHISDVAPSVLSHHTHSMDLVTSNLQHQHQDTHTHTHICTRSKNNRNNLLRAWSIFRCLWSASSDAGCDVRTSTVSSSGCCRCFICTPGGLVARFRIAVSPSCALCFCKDRTMWYMVSLMKAVT